MQRPVYQQLCLDFGFSDAGSFAPRQVSVGTQSIIDGCAGLWV